MTGSIVILFKIFILDYALYPCYKVQNLIVIKETCMSSEVTLTEANFDTEVLQSKLPVLVDFWAEWCGPCRMLAPTIDELAIEFSGKAKVGKVNVDQNQMIAERYGIRSIPTLILFKNGTIVEQIVGSQTKEALKGKLIKAL
jgi:thioredoxin 1